MKRWALISSLTLMSAFVVMAPAAAQASTVSGGELSNGKPVKARISTHGRQIRYTFSARARQHVTFQVTHFNFSDGSSGGEVELRFYKPASRTSYTSCAFTDNGFCDLTTPIAGTWTVRLV